ncbi:hypothetical protein LJC16_03195, partial [Bacteroidales bacterium OttesenSCG-928-C19]|nr:hypothetical protein [Bacteroidales bacterium OttesenSCG-928-C19]
MKNIYNLKRNLKVNILILSVFVTLLYLPHVLNAQVKVPFTQRASQYSPEKKIYNIKGDFTMIGNTNLTLQNYDENIGNSSRSMKYVDIDNDPSTINSSSAVLQFTQENNANHECTDIVYAGLYWTGRAHSGDSPESFSINSTNETQANGVTKEGYQLTISQTTIDDGTRNERLATYVFTPQNGGAKVTFKYTTWWTFVGGRQYKVTVQVGTGVETEIAISSDGDDDDPTVTFNEPYVLTTGDKILAVRSLKKRRKHNTVNDKFNAGISYGGANLNKRTVKLKHSTGTYFTVTATSNNIYYPSDADGNMYSAYAEITDYVRQYGVGEYTVANIALREGSGGSTGYYGGWGLIVVYQNSKMKWRDITIFDGHAYVAGSVTASHELPISGFNTVQSGNVNMKLGIMAGEGDRDITGDYLQIQKLATEDWLSLSHSENSNTNFFNSSINTGGNSRNPNLKNNTGLDITMFNIPNQNNSVITNNQKSTKFKYGSTQDTYIIFCLAMGVDAYTPEIEALNQIGKINGNSVPSGQPLNLLPNQNIEYSLEIRNIGNEPIESTVITIPIPYTAKYVSCSAEYM